VRAVGEQFARPTGILGILAGVVMAGSNRDLNRWAVSLLDLRGDERVLEVGFGPGVAIQELSRSVPDGFVFGLDGSGVMLRQASRRNARAIREGRVALALGDVAGVADLCASGAPFDRILSVNSAPFWEDRPARLRDLLGQLRPGGGIALAVQPREPGVTEETALRVGEGLLADLAETGLSRLSLERKPLKPVSAVCAIGFRDAT
jgi:SAM-dependent methyltransferase